jgi:hypothetical protein
MGLFNDIDPIFFYHKSVKPLLAMGFNGVVAPSGEERYIQTQDDPAFIQKYEVLRLDIFDFFLILLS